MDDVWLVAATWLGLALLAAFVSTWLRISTAVCEIAVGALAPLLLKTVFGVELLNPKTPWIVFLAGAGALLLTFLAGSELDPAMLQATWKEAVLVGLVAFAGPFLLVTAAAHYLLGWHGQGSWIAGVALSTASVSVVYTIMLELGINQSRFAKSILAASYVNNLITVIALGLIFAPFSERTAVFVGLSTLIFLLLPFLSSRFFGRFRGRVSEPDVRYLLFLLFGLGGLAVWAGGEAILPAYVMGMVLAGLVGKNASLIHHLRILAFGILTPFYFLRAGAQVSLAALVASPLLFSALLAAKTGSKLAGVLPALRLFRYGRREGLYYGLMISTGLGLGTIAASFGLNRGIIDQQQYSHLVAAVIGSAVIPTALANAYFMPKHLVVKTREAGAKVKVTAGARR